MTREQFKIWVHNTVSHFARGEGQVAHQTRMHAEAVRPHDPELADLYVKQAEASETIRRYLVTKTKNG